MIVKTRTLAAWKEYQKRIEPSNDALHYALKDWETDMQSMGEIIARNEHVVLTKKHEELDKTKGW